MIVSMSTVSSNAASPSGVTMMPRSVFARKPRAMSAWVVIVHSTRALGVLTSGSACVAYAHSTVALAMESGAKMGGATGFMQRSRSLQPGSRP